MRFPAPLFPATLVRRYKRFLADVVLASGETVTVHCANPGSMIGLNAPGARVWLSKSDNPNRKLAHSWELIEVDFGGGAELVGINTVHPNALAAEAIAAGAIPELAGYAHDPPRGEIRQELARRFPARSIRRGRPAIVEIKNVHLMRAAGTGRISRRGDQARGEASRRAQRHGRGRRARGDAVPDPDRLGAALQARPRHRSGLWQGVRRRARAPGSRSSPIAAASPATGSR